MSARRLALPVALVALAVLASCGGEPKPENAPVGVETEPALALFQLARVDEPGRDRLAEVIADEHLDDRRAELLDALAELRSSEAPQVVAVEPLPDLDRVAVDLEAPLPGPGSAVFTVQTARLESGVWRVVWFGGPDVEWPPRRTPRESLSTSPIPR